MFENFIQKLFLQFVKKEKKIIFYIFNLLINFLCFSSDSEYESSEDIADSVKSLEGITSATKNKESDVAMDSDNEDE